MWHAFHRIPLVYGAFLAPLLLPALVCSSASAWMIGNLPKGKLPPQSCKLTLSGSPEKQTDGSLLTSSTSCSATIIGTSHLLTAAHCFLGQEIATGIVDCPNEPPRHITSWTLPKKFVPGTSTAEMDRIDIALVRIAENFKTAPIRLPKGPDELQRLFELTQLGVPPNCSLFGYGEDATLESGEHNGRAVLFEQWIVGRLVTNSKTRSRRAKEISNQVENIKAWWRKDSLSLTFRAQDFDTEKNLTNAVRSGDSGGGLICLNEKGEAILMGVARGYSVEEDVSGREAHVASVLAVTHSLELIQALLQKDPNLSLTGRPEKSTPSPGSRGRSAAAGTPH